MIGSGRRRDAAHERMVQTAQMAADRRKAEAVAAAGPPAQPQSPEEIAWLRRFPPTALMPAAQWTSAGGPCAMPPGQYWRTACPRCGARSMVVWLHKHHRLACSSDCPAFEGRCDNPPCEYPGFKGSSAWPSGVPFWAGPQGGWVSEDARRIFDIALNPIEPMPPPFGGKAEW